MPKIYGRIYCITNLVNGKRYVGKTTLSIENRWRAHCKCASVRIGLSSYLHRAIAKHGVGQFKIRQLAVVRSMKHLDICERFWIKKLGTLVPDGYNLQGGGEGGVLHPLSCAKIAAARKRAWSNAQYRTHMVLKVRVQWSDPKYRRAREELLRSEKYRSRMSASCKLRWARPEYRAKQIAGRRSLVYRAKMLAMQEARWA